MTEGVVGRGFDGPAEAVFPADDRIALLDRINLLERQVAIRDLIIEHARSILEPLP